MSQNHPAKQHTNSNCSQVHHRHRLPNNKKILCVCLTIILLFMVVEFVGGYLFNSLALIADAGHMANDSLSLLLALIALFLSNRMQQWFALINGISLIVVAIWVFQEAINRWQNPTEIMALEMLIVAFIGLIVNILVAYIMLKADHSNLNIKAAYLHVLADMFGSVVAIVAGMAAYLGNWTWVDTIASVLLSTIILRSGWKVSILSINQLRKK